MTGLAERLRSVADLLNEVPPSPTADLRVTAYENVQTIDLTGEHGLILALAEHVGADLDGHAFRGLLDGAPLRLTPTLLMQQVTYSCVPCDGPVCEHGSMNRHEAKRWVPYVPGRQFGPTRPATDAELPLFGGVA